MEIEKIIIAVDGYSSTGKSSLAKLIAKEYSFLYLDSGALYRAITLFAQERELIDSQDNIDEVSLERELETFDFSFKKVGDIYHSYIGDRDVENQIRQLSVASQVSPISTLSCVRDFVDNKLRELSADKGAVMDGRDIGTTVFPNAEIKLFVTASQEIRAKRRYDEMIAKGEEANLEEVKENLKSRDYIDSHREISPLRQAEDAFVLDNSNMTLAEELIWFRGLLQGKFDIKQ